MSECFEELWKGTYEGIIAQSSTEEGESCINFFNTWFEDASSYLDLVPSQNVESEMETQGLEEGSDTINKNSSGTNQTGS